VKEPIKFHNYETEKITRKASDAMTQQNISSCLVLPPKIIMHDALMLFSERPPIYASSCMMMSGGRTEQHVVIGLESWLQLIRICRHSFSILIE